MSEMKYVILATPSGSQLPIVFDDSMSHNSVRPADVYGYRLVSAGFLVKRDAGWTVCGRSGSLDVGSRPEDLDVILEMLFSPGEADDDKGEGKA